MNDLEIDDLERDVRRELALLHEQFLKAAQPYHNILRTIYAIRPRPMVIPRRDIDPEVLAQLKEWEGEG